jgi:hypothetical protein
LYGLGFSLVFLSTLAQYLKGIGPTFAFFVGLIFLFVFPPSSKWHCNQSRPSPSILEGVTRFNIRCCCSYSAFNMSTLVGSNVEKGDHSPPTFHDGVKDQPKQPVAARPREENFWTRNGLNFTSFKKRDYGRGIVELDRSMKTRHLHMIAIGGSIGAGFYVGSGSALSKGVSN